jgi:hypothetical protein
MQSKDSERKRKAQEKADKDDERVSKRRRNVIGAIPKAPTLLEKIFEGGPSLVNSFHVTDLKALLAHDDPRGGVEGNKAELLERVMALGSVKLAVATDPDSSTRPSRASRSTKH